MTNKALFLDRDGIINIDHGYVSQPKEIEFVEGIFDLCRFFQQLDYRLIIVTNQSGIARGYYSEKQFLDLMDWMSLQFSDKGIQLTDTFFCPHHSVHGKGIYQKKCACRKPQPGMLIEAAAKHNIELAKSVMVGDKLSDMQAAISAGVCIGFLVSSDPAAKITHNDYYTVSALNQIPTIFHKITA